MWYDSFNICDDGNYHLIYGIKLWDLDDDTDKYQYYLAKNTYWGWKEKESGEDLTDVKVIMYLTYDKITIRPLDKSSIFRDILHAYRGYMRKRDTLFPQGLTEEVKSKLLKDMMNNRMVNADFKEIR